MVRYVFRNGRAIAAEFGFFFDAHRAADDCHALIEILTRPLPGDPEARTVLSALRASALRPTVRLLAASTPFETKDMLKGRGYRWEPGEGSGRKGWYRDVALDEERAERDWLTVAVYRGAPDIVRFELDAWSRFSDRAWSTGAR